MVHIFYGHNVVGGNTYSIYTKMGVGKRPDATFWGTHNDGWIWNLIKGLGSIFYKRSVVGNNTYSIYTKMGATLPVLKNEIKNFFFARLGTGRTSQNRRATAVFSVLYKITANTIHHNLRGIFEKARKGLHQFAMIN